MLNKLKKDNKGFTIIEVMIVLAIAGLILLIVFLAVPALQRNSRNTARKNDASRIATSYNNVVTNNNGTVPSASDSTQVSAILNDAGTLAQYSLTANAGGSTCALNSGNLTVCAPTASGSVNALSSGDGVTIVEHATCGNLSNNGATPPVSDYTFTYSAGSREAAVMYTLEGGAGNTVGCLSE